MKYGQIVLASTKKGFVPNAIKWFTDSKFSHSFITIPEILRIPMCIEAASSGVDTLRFDTGYEDDLNEGYETWTVNVGQKARDKAIIALLNDLEVGYGYFEFFYFVARKIAKMFGKDIKNKNNWFTQGIICSQLCVAYIKACGLEHVLVGYGNGSISPEDLRNIMIAHPQYFTKDQSVRLSDR